MNNCDRRLRHMVAKYPALVGPGAGAVERGRLPGAARRLAERLAAALKCAGCGQTLDGPMTLPCGDTLCRRCVDVEAATPGPGAVTPCPKCGQLAAREGLHTNVLLQDILDRIQGNKTSRSVGHTSHSYKLRSHADIGQTRSKVPRAADGDDVQVPPAKRRRKDENGSVDDSSSEFDLCLSAQDVECVVCGRCLFEPVTTACGHTFCGSCVSRVLDYGLACPLCMSPLASGGAGPVCRALATVARRLAPGEHAARAAAARRAAAPPRHLPVFVCTAAFPGAACPLHVCEPRYRLLTRRCLHTKRRRFAMAPPAPPPTVGGGAGGVQPPFAPYGTVLEVRDAVHLPDGTSILTTVGTRRFRVLERAEKDGYDTARVQYLRDASVPLHQLPVLRNLHDRVHRKAVRWVRSLAPGVQAEVERSLGAMPSVEPTWWTLPDGPAWAWWLMPVLPLSAHLQLGFLSTTVLDKRLRAIDKLLDRVSARMRTTDTATATPATASTTASSPDTCHTHAHISATSAMEL